LLCFCSVQSVLMTVQKKATSVDSFSKMELLFYYSRLSENFLIKAVKIS